MLVQNHDKLVQIRVNISINDGNYLDVVQIFSFFSSAKKLRNFFFRGYYFWLIMESFRIGIVIPFAKLILNYFLYKAALYLIKS